MATKRKGLVVYTEEMKNIIKEEAEKHPNNLREGFRVAAERIKEELNEPNVTTDKISTHYYTYFSDRKSASNGKAKKTTKKTSLNKKATNKNSNVVAKDGEKVFTEANSDKQYMVVKGLSSKLEDEKKIQLINDLYSELS